MAEWNDHESILGPEKNPENTSRTKEEAQNKGKEGGFGAR